MKYLPKQTVLAVLTLVVISASHADIITFDDNASYDNNFVERNNGIYVSRDAGGYLTLNNTGAGIATADIYNTAASGGSGGSGGTTINSPYNTFGGTTAFTIQADYLQSNPQGGPAGTSFGFYIKAAASATPTTAYAALFRLTDSAADFRVFDSNGNPGTSGVGTQIGSTLTYNSGFAADTYYTLKLEVVDVSGNVQFTGSIWTQGGTEIKTFASITDTTSPFLGAGQVGFRWGNDGGSNTRIDNFSISVVPEPGTLAILGGGLAALVGFRQRRHGTRIRPVS